MALIFGLRIVCIASLLVLSIALSKRTDCEATGEKCGSEDHIAFQRTDIRLLALVDTVQSLDNSVDIIKRVLYLIVGITRGEL